MGPKGHPKEVPWDQKVIPPKTTLYAVLQPPMVREVFSKKLKTGNPEALGSGGPYKAGIWFPGAFMIYLDTTKKLSEKPYI